MTIKLRKLHIKVECVETGFQTILSRAEFFSRFGKREGRELLKGCHSTIIAIETNEPINKNMPNFLNKTL